MLDDVDNFSFVLQYDSWFQSSSESEIEKSESRSRSIVLLKFGIKDPECVTTFDWDCFEPLELRNNRFNWSFNCLFDSFIWFKSISNFSIWLSRISNSCSILFFSWAWFCWSAIKFFSNDSKRSCPSISAGVLEGWVILKTVLDSGLTESSRSFSSLSVRERVRGSLT